MIREFLELCESIGDFAFHTALNMLIVFAFIVTWTIVGIAVITGCYLAVSVGVWLAQAILDGIGIA